MIGNILIVALLVGACFFFYSYGKKPKGMNGKITESLFDVGPCDVQTVKGTLLFSDIVSYFKSLSLKKGRDIPFVADANADKFRKVLKTVPVGNVVLFLGTYNEETDRVENEKIIVADAMDEKCSEVLKNDHLVVLN